MNHKCAILMPLEDTVIIREIGISGCGKYPVLGRNFPAKAGIRHKPRNKNEFLSGLLQKRDNPYSTAVPGI
jgi:hypothetical protein